MKIGISYWQGRISPVFDVTRHLLVSDLDFRVEEGRYDVLLLEKNFGQRARQLAELGVEVLICGAISHDLKSAMEEEGVEVKNLVRGDVEAVLDAYREHHLDQEQFRMPGPPELGSAGNRPG
jgi:predicted Fe-Mo cluster-binding NifX family protein